MGAVSRVFLQMAIQVGLVRFLGPVAYGDATAAMLVLAIGWIMGEAGFGSALIQKDKLTNHDVAYAIGWVLLVSISISVILASFSSAIAAFFDNSALSSLILVSTFLIPLQALSNIPMSLLRRSLDMRALQLLQTISYLISYGIVGLVLAWLEFGAWSLVCAYACQTIINLVGSYSIVRHPLNVTLRGDQKLRSFGLYITGTNCANWAIENLDRLIIGRYWGIVSLGEYSAASNLSRSPASFLVGSAQGIIFAAGSRVQNDYTKLKDAYLASLCSITIISLPIFMYLGINSEIVIHMVYGSKWINSAPLFTAFCLSLPFYIGLAITGPVLGALGNASIELKVQILCAVILTISFLLVTGESLKLVIFIIPIISFLRFILVYIPLASKLDIDYRELINAIQGGIILSLIILVTSIIFKKFFEISNHNTIAEIFLSITLCGLALLFSSARLICKELNYALRSLSVENNSVQIICTLLRIK